MALVAVCGFRRSLGTGKSLSFVRAQMTGPAYTFEVLSGLPGYGPLPLQFSSTGQGTYREGYVVEFRPKGMEKWIGNCQPGLTKLFHVVAHPDGRRAIVIAGGEAYVIDPATRELVTAFGGSFESVVEMPALAALLFSNGIRFELYDSVGLKWKTKRLSWDGMRNVQVLDSTVVGEGWCFDESWHKFSVELSNGESTGGAYFGPEP